MGEGNEGKYGTAVVLNTISQIHQVDGKHADALKAAKQSVEAYQEIGYKTGEANAMHSLAYLELDSIFNEVDEKPDTFTKAQSDELEAAWKDGIKAMNLFIDKARKIHVKQFQPTKTIFLNDPRSRTFTKVNIYDTTMPEAVADEDEEEEEGEDE